MKRKIIAIEILLILIGITAIGYFYYFPDKSVLEVISILYKKFITEEIIEEQVQNNIKVEGTINISNITIYGRHLNIEGNINDLENVKLVLYNSKNEYEYDIVIDSNNNFKTSELINEGINLDEIEEGTYKLYIYSNLDEKYYELHNKSDYQKELEYYTVTRNNNNNKVTISYNDEIKINVIEEELPEDVYDIVIDPGHGGNDPGAVYNNIYEKTYTLSLSKSIKTKLESLGYKVLLTRNTDKWLDAYGEDGRVTKAYESHAKYLISVHINALDEYTEYGEGLEIYVCPNSDIAFAQSLASSIISKVNTKYSSRDKYKIESGIYTRTFSEDEIKEYSNEAIEEGFKPYNYTDTTPYYYMLRETGGIITKAYVDGRDTSKDANNYYNSNIGVESYIIEFGYISNTNDMYNIKYNSDKYGDAISTTFFNFLKQ